MLRQRLLSAIIFVPPLLAIVWLGEPWFSALVALAAFVGALEFYRLASPWPWRPLGILGALGAALLVLSGHWPEAVAPILAGLVMASLLGLVLASRVENAFNAWAWTLAGALYVGWLLRYAVLIRASDGGREWALLALLSAFACDSGAYLVGRAFGRRPLLSAISPGKTWEGAGGGFLWAVGAVPLLSWLLGLPMAWGQALFLGGAIGVFAQMGDLGESLLKRSAGVKDAGHLIPGHGGLLDRLDSVVFTLPVVYYYMIWVTQ